MSKKFKKIGLPMIVIIIVFLIFLNCFFYNQGIYIFPGDSVEQMYQFYLGGWERIRSGSLSQFEWSLGVGGNVMSYVYYFLTSPFFYITLLFPREFIKYLFLDLNMLKIILLFFTTYYWTGKLTKNIRSRLIASFIITFSGWVFFYFAYNMFLDAFLLYPLILGFAEVYLKENKILPLVLGIGALGIINYYFLYMFVPFLCLYALIRYIEISRNNLSWINLVKAAVKFIGNVLLGIGISAIVLIPCAYLIMNSSRFTENTVKLFDTIGLNELIYFVSTIFSPVFDRFNASYYIPEYTHDFIGWGGGCSLFALIITPLLLPLLLCLKDKVKRNSYLSCYLLLSAILIFQYLWYLLQRSIDTRWTYMFLILNAMTLIEINDELEQDLIKKRCLWFSGGLTIICILGFLLNMYLNHYWPRKQLIEVGIVSLLEIVFVIIYVIYYQLKKRHSWILIFVLALEAIASGRIFVAYNYGINYNYFEQPEHSTEAIDYIKSMDDGYYRILYASESYQIPGAPGAFVITTPNEPFAKNYPGFSFYNTVYNVETDEFYDRSRSNWFVSEAMGRNKVYNLMSAKYWVTYDFETQIPEHYEFYYRDKQSGYTVYRNPYFIELGKTYKETINKDYFKTLPVFLQDQVMQDYLVTEFSENNVYELNSNLEYVGQLADEKHREFKLDVPLSNGTLYIINYGVSEITLSLYSDDNLICSQPYSQYNYVDINLSNNMEIDKIVVEGENNSGVAAFMDVYFEPNDGSYDQWYQQIQQEKFENVLFDRDYISADINLKDERYIFTSIPYDKGWKVYVNGEKVPYEKVNLGFIGLRLGSGNYHLEFRYEIPYLKVGAIISLGSLIILILLSLRNSKKFRKS